MRGNERKEGRKGGMRERKKVEMSEKNRKNERQKGYKNRSNRRGERKKLEGLKRKIRKK